HLDPVGDGFERRHADRTLLARLEQAGDQLLPLEALPAAVLLHHHVRDLVDPFVAREAAAALEAFTAAADHVALAALARVDDLVAEVAAERALHTGASPPSDRAWSPSCFTPARLSPSCIMNNPPARVTGRNDAACSTSAAPT